MLVVIWLIQWLVGERRLGRRAAARRRAPIGELGGSRRVISDVRSHESRLDRIPRTSPSATATSPPCDDVSFTIARGHARHAARAVRLRQDHDAADDRRPRAADARARSCIGGDDVTRSVAAAERDVSMVFQSYALFPHMTRARERPLRPRRVGHGRSRGATSARASRSRPSASTGFDGGCRRSCPAASSSASRSRARWCSSRRCCCSTSRCRISTRGCAGRCARRSATCSSGSALTVVYVTHDQAEAMAVSDRIIVMNKAVIAQEGAPRELYEQPRDPFVAGFMGDANRVRGIARPPRCARWPTSRSARVTLSLPHRGARRRRVSTSSIRPEAIDARARRRRADRGDGAQGGLPRRHHGVHARHADRRAVRDLHRRRPAARGGSVVGVALANHGVVVIPRALE